MAVDITVLTQRIDLRELYPPFRAIYESLLKRCSVDRQTDYYAISGLRSYEEQRALFAQGRVELADGTLIEDDDPSTKIVTKAPPGLSSHNFGIAADSSRDSNADRAGLQPSWNMPDYAVLAEEAKALGLDAAFYWTKFREGPHVQLPLARHGLKLLDLKTLYESELRAKGTPVFALDTVWEYLDTFDWSPE